MELNNNNYTSQRTDLENTFLELYTTIEEFENLFENKESNESQDQDICNTLINVKFLSGNQLSLVKKQNLSHSTQSGLLNNYKKIQSDLFKLDSDQNEHKSKTNEYKDKMDDMSKKIVLLKQDINQRDIKIAQLLNDKSSLKKHVELIKNDQETKMTLYRDKINLINLEFEEFNQISLKSKNKLDTLSEILHLIGIDFYSFDFTIIKENYRNVLAKCLGQDSDNNSLNLSDFVSFVNKNNLKSNNVKTNIMKSNDIESNETQNNQQRYNNNQQNSEDLQNNKINTKDIKSNDVKYNDVQSNDVKSNKININSQNKNDNTIKQDEAKIFFENELFKIFSINELDRLQFKIKVFLQNNENDFDNKYDNISQNINDFDLLLNNRNEQHKDKNVETEKYSNYQNNYTDDINQNNNLIINEKENNDLNQNQINEILKSENSNSQVSNIRNIKIINETKINFNYDYIDIEIKSKNEQIFLSDEENFLKDYSDEKNKQKILNRNEELNQIRNENQTLESNSVTQNEEIINESNILSSQECNISNKQTQENNENPNIISNSLKSKIANKQNSFKKSSIVPKTYTHKVSKQDEDDEIEETEYDITHQLNHSIHNNVKIYKPQYEQINFTASISNFHMENLQSNQSNNEKEQNDYIQLNNNKFENQIKDLESQMNQLKEKIVEKNNIITNMRMRSNDNEIVALKSQIESIEKINIDQNIKIDSLNHKLQNITKDTKPFHLSDRDENNSKQDNFIQEIFLSHSQNSNSKLLSVQELNKPIHSTSPRGTSTQPKQWNNLFALKDLPLSKMPTDKKEADADFDKQHKGKFNKNNQMLEKQQHYLSNARKRKTDVEKNMGKIDLAIQLNDIEKYDAGPVREVSRPAQFKIKDLLNFKTRN